MYCLKKILLLAPLFAGVLRGDVIFHSQEGDLRARASFANGTPALDFSINEPRLGRVWYDASSHFPPDDGNRGRVALTDCFAVDALGQPYWDARAQASIQGEGVVNPLAGTFSGWFKRSELMDNGGPLLSGRYSSAGAPHRAGIVWALGIGGYRGEPVPLDRPSPVAAGRFYLYTPWVAAIADRAVPDTDWVYLAAVWDAEKGVKLFMNGTLVADTFGEGAEGVPPDRVLNIGSRVHPVVTGLLPVQLDQLQIHAQKSGGMRDLLFYDYPLSDAGVALLHAGEPEAVAFATHAEDVAMQMEQRAQWLGWTPDNGDALLRVVDGEALVVTEPAVVEARENLRAAGWLAVNGRSASLFPWWYHGYSESGPRTLSLEYGSAFRPDYLVMSGDVKGNYVLSEGEGGQPLSFSLEPVAGSLVTHIRHDGAPRADRFFLTHESGSLSNVRLFQVDYGKENIPAGRRIDYYAANSTDIQAVPLESELLAEFVGSYKPQDRRYSVLSQSRPSASSVERINGLQAYHLFTPVAEEDYYLGALRLQIPFVGLSAPARFQVRVHDSFGLWQEWGRLDFVIEPDAGGEALLDVTLNLRDTLVAQGESLWVSFVLESDAGIKTDADAAVCLTVIEAEDSAVAEQLWKQAMLRTMRDEMEAISEPRPWSRMDGSDTTSWWLSVAYPQYRIIDRIGQRLRERYPDDHLVQSWFQFTHPAMPNPSRAITPPSDGDAPRWATLALANLKLYQAFVYFWTDERTAPSGEMGSWVGDDSDLLHDWLDVHFISDADGRIGRQLVHFADQIWNVYRSRGTIPAIENGLNTRWTDDLHAYEDGINVQSAAFWARYGDPVLFSRLMQTANRYEGFLFRQTQSGSQALNSTGKGQVYWSSSEPPKGDPNYHPAYWNLMLQPGLMALWYSGNPTLEKFFDGLGREKLKTPAGDVPLFVWPESPVIGGLYAHFGGERYLDKLVDVAALGSGLLKSRHWRSFNPMLLFRKDLNGLDAAAVVTESRQDMASRFAELDTQNLGGMDRRFDKNWVEWKLSGNVAYLEEGLEELYRKLYYTMPALTVAEQSGDRVAIPKSLISLIYLGGVAAVRNDYFYPDIAVSYSGLNEDYAALVLQSDEDNLVIAFYNFSDEPQAGYLRPWRLKPGEYALHEGAYSVGSTPPQFDALSSLGQKQLLRGDFVPIVLPPRTSWVWSASVQKADTPLLPRADLALSAAGVRWLGEGRLEIDIYNIGSLTVPASSLEVVTVDGGLLVATTIPELNWPENLVPKPYVCSVILDGYDSLPKGTVLRVMVNRPEAFNEITFLNNSLMIQVE